MGSGCVVCCLRRIGFLVGSPTPAPSESPSGVPTIHACHGHADEASSVPACMPVVSMTAAVSFATVFLMNHSGSLGCTGIWRFMFSAPSARSSVWGHGLPAFQTARVACRFCKPSGQRESLGERQPVRCGGGRGWGFVPGIEGGLVVPTIPRRSLLLQHMQTISACSYELHVRYKIGILICCSG